MTLRNCILLTSANKQLYDEWHAKALMDDDVYPYLSFGRWQGSLTITDGDWEQVVLMDTSKTAVMIFYLDRQSAMVSANICIWSLSTKGLLQQYVAGIMMHAVGELCRRYGIKYIDGACHASNKKSIRLLSARLGRPWGRKPKGAWNPKTGQMEDSVHFRHEVIRPKPLKEAEEEFPKSLAHAFDPD